MYKEISELFMYGTLDKESILYKLGNIFEKFETTNYVKEDLIREIKTELKKLLIVATDYGFDDNLWHNYIAYFLITNENPFSLVCEKNKITEGTVTKLVEEDFSLIRKIFLYDFSKIESELGIDSFTTISNYKAVSKNKQMYNWNVSEKVRNLSKRLENAKNDKEFYQAITDFYYDYGVGMFGLNKAFRIEENTNGLIFKPINNMELVTLNDLVGYEYQKEQLVDNTLAFCLGKKANNVLLYGDSGTGKSTSIKAIVNEYYDKGLRMIEIYKHQFKYLSNIISTIKNRNYKFIIYMDDLSFEEHEIEYKYLKAIIEGGVETKPNNVLIYATSNRRHLIKETWNDRNDQDNTNDRHHSDTVEEKLSLVNRFGVTIGYSKPSPNEFKEIVKVLAKRQGIEMDEKELLLKANQWELSHGGISGRCAEQFISNLLYQVEKNK